MPKKNISSRISDIKWPGRGVANEEENTKKVSPLDVEALGFGSKENRDSEKKFPRSPFSVRRFVVGFLVAALIIGGFFGAKVYKERKAAVFSLKENIEKINSLSGGRDIMEIMGFSDLEPGDLFKNFKSIFKRGFGFYGNIIEVSSDFLAFLQEVDLFEDRFFSYIFDKKGSEIISHLKRINGKLEVLGRRLGDLDKRDVKGADFFSLNLELQRWQDFLSSLITWLESPEPKHLALFLQNSSEIRPTGGFWGSFIQLTLREGILEEIKAIDINEVDREFGLKIIPPKPLQLVSKSFRTADANWFFDFPVSARKGLEFMEASGFYKKNSVKFDGAVALSSKVVSDILEVLGPIELEGRGILIDAGNFIDEIQNKVQIAQAKGVKNPKEVVGEAVEAVFRKIVSLDNEKRKELLGFFEKWVSEKDLVFYFRNSDFQNFIEHYGWGGNVYDLPQNFEGDYLAVVSSNIGGEKSDRFIKQAVVLESQLNLDGVLRNRLVVKKFHSGDKSEYWWYRAANQSYIRIFVPLGANLENFSGGKIQSVKPKLNYAKEGYISDPDVEKIESTEESFSNYPAISGFIESGKKVFSTWAKTPTGGSSEIILDYSRRLFLPPQDGQVYTFVFEKQTGVSGDYKFSISAPVGFKWKENGLPVYEYETSDPPGRLILNLTMEKIKI